MFVKIAEKDEIAPGGMKAFTIRGTEITICNDGGTYYALSRRCGHMNAPLDRGTLVGYIITCPMHYSQFDAKSAKALSSPMLPGYAGRYKLPEFIAAIFRRFGGLVSEISAYSLNTFFFRGMGRAMSHVKTCDMKTFRVRVEDKNILVDI